MPVGTGGKWTTYRKMAQDAIDAAVDSGNFTAVTSPCRTMHLPLVGSAGYTRSLFTDVAQHYVVPHRPGAIDTQVAKYLAGEIFLHAHSAVLPRLCFADESLGFWGSCTFCCMLLRLAALSLRA